MHGLAIRGLSERRHRIAGGADGAARLFARVVIAATFTVVAAVVTFARPAHAAEGDFTPVPALHSHVTDLTGTLSASDKSALEQKLASWEGQKGAQFAILMVPTTQPDTIDQYSQRVTDQWKIGRKGIDDGVLLLIAKDDKKLRIQVGKGFEGALTDVTSKRIIEENIVPPLRKGDFAGGINAGVDKVIAVVAGEALPPPPEVSNATGSSHSSGWPINDWLGFLLFAGLGLFWFAASALNRIFGRVGGSLVGGGIAGGVGWFLTSVVAVGLGAGVIVFILLLIALAARGGGIGPGGHPGGWVGGGFPGGFGGSSSGGSSWSGGGGDFGGGGASGSWGGGSSGS